MRTRLIACAAALAALALAAPAQAEFGFADVNTGLPGDPEVAAYPGSEAVWAGTCDLRSATTEAGGVGAHNGGIDPPAIRAHCLDVGTSTVGNAVNDSPWPVGTEPAWRLDPVVQAGAHPDASASFWFEFGDRGKPDGQGVKDIVVKLPPGVVGSPTALPQCSARAVQAVPAECDASAQAGITSLGFGEYTFGEVTGIQTQPIYNIEARDTVTAEFAVAGVASLFNVPITARGRTNSDYGVDTLALLIPQFAPIAGQAATFWGVPWAAEHDRFRIHGVNSTGIDRTGAHLSGFSEANRVPYEPSWGPIRPFFTNPTECSGEPLPVEVLMDSWADPVARGGQWVEARVLTDTLNGCEQLEFEPSISLRPTVSVSDSPSGLDVKLEIPQNNDPPAEALGNPDLAHDPDEDTGAPAYWRTPAGRATAHLKDTTVALPEGTSFNPAAANGVRGCSTAQIGLTDIEPKATFNNDQVQCPEESKMGTLKIVSPLLPDPLFGEVYAAPQHDNPFPGSLTAIYMVAQDEERGLSIKLPGKVDLDPDTGQISTTFLDNPQLPFTSFELKFKSGPRAPLNTPAVCGQFRNSISLIPWSFPHSGPEPVIEDRFEIDSAPNNLACVTEPEDRLFTPGFAAGTTPAIAGAYTGFTMDVTRIDGQQEISSIAVNLPPGLTANLTHTPYCPEHLIAAAKLRSGKEETADPSCPAVSRMGHVTAMAGAGPLPLPTSGQLYIAGPYDPDGAGPKPLAPFSIVVVAPAIAGGTPQQPTFDLGNVVIRSAGYVDPRTAKVTIASTPVPYIVGGVPLRIRHIQVAIDKPAFMLNPTNCAPNGVVGTIGGAADPFDPADDSAASLLAPFQVSGCAGLGFKPKLSLRFFGKHHRGANQRLKAVLTPRPGDANISRAAVTLPRSTFLDQANIRTICTRVQFASNACPPGSIYGYAKAWTPLLREPVQGPVYLRSSDNQLPDMVAHLRGQFDVELVGKIDSVRGGIRSIFDVVPDAPVSKFVLNMRGGKRSLIVNSKNICRFPGKATVNLKAQNGRRHRFRPKIRNSCKKQRRARGKGKGKKRRRGGHRRAGKGGRR
ncbi:MAG: hypothetical protein WDZ46_09730 [Solirubrobacterales bacterium]